MNKCPFISVIIPVYNVENYLRRCLDSVIIQTYSNLEIILVNDGSTDGSGKICNEYAEKDSRIRVIHKENGGLSDARNRGIKEASADYVAFIDSDDFVNTQYIQRLLWILLQNDADIAICGYYHGNRNKFPESMGGSRKVKCFDANKMLENWHGKYKHYETTPCNKLYKRTLFTENEIYYPVGYFNEDVFTTHLLIDKAQKIVMTNEKLYYYYQRNNSIMNTISERKIKDCIYAQNARIDFFMKRGYKDAYERLTIKRQKRYILEYFRTISKSSLREINNEIVYLYNKSCSDVCHFETTNIVELIIFHVFEYVQKIISFANKHNIIHDK